MPTYGLTTDGLLIKTYEVVLDEMKAALRAAFGESIDLDYGILARFLAIVAERYAELWEQLEAVYSSQDPDKATATALEALCALTGTLKNPATKSTVPLILSGTPATLVSSGSRAATTSTGKKFETTAGATITALTAWAATTGYVVNDMCTNASRTYICITSGTSAGSGGPTTTDADITDGTVHWRYMGEGTGAVDVAAQAVDYGPTIALSGDITTIDTPVGGWSSVINLLDAAPGSNIETDEHLRIRRELELGGAGSTPADALRAALLEVEDVTAATVFVNNTDVTDPDGVPPHAVECMVRGGADQDLWDLLLDSVAAGIKTYGNTTGTAVDSQGTAHAMAFTRPTEVPIYVSLGLTYNGKLYPSTGDTMVEQAIIDWGDAQETGKDATPSGISAQAFQVPGVLEVSWLALSTTSISTVTNWAQVTAYTVGDVVVSMGRVYRCTTSGTSTDLGIGSPPSATGSGIIDGTVVWEFIGATIPMTSRQLATYDTSRITIVSTAATP